LPGEVRPSKSELQKKLMGLWGTGMPMRAVGKAVNQRNTSALRTFQPEANSLAKMIIASGFQDG
jgi:hypothetical protein